mmetsp:Transcript_3787/g.12665  ORF Transcript_3787/g.12665 Transcript_3787/m.12665 type:complete len:280 (+) Transcript_3787:127-966(+)
MAATPPGRRACADRARCARRSASANALSPAPHARATPPPIAPRQTRAPAGAPRGGQAPTRRCRACSRSEWAPRRPQRRTASPRAQALRFHLRRRRRRRLCSVVRLEARDELFLLLAVDIEAALSQEAPEFGDLECLVASWDVGFLADLAGEDEMVATVPVRALRAECGGGGVAQLRRLAHKNGGRTRAAVRLQDSPDNRPLADCGAHPWLRPCQTFRRAVLPVGVRLLRRCLPNKIHRDQQLTPVAAARLAEVLAPGEPFLVHPVTAKASRRCIRIPPR